ncbi:SDR family NAD(P)-dependent oxidoreductase [Candidatus Omnitrophota bacterium]
MNWKGKNVFVTGAGGFIGSHLVEELIQRGAKVKALVKYNSRNDFGNLELLPKEISREIEIKLGDLRDSATVSKAIKGSEIVFHLGALIAIPYSYINPADFVQTNVGGTTNVLDACLEQKIEMVVHTSTSEVYGSAQYVPIDEQHPVCGQSPYSASKIGADKLAESYYRSFNLPVATIRPFNTYGPRQSARAIIPTIITQALTKPAVDGSVKIKTGSLFPSRDFNYVQDVVRAFLLIAEVPDCIGQVINIGSGSDITIERLIEEIAAILNLKLAADVDNLRIRPKKSEVERLLADNSKAKELLSWQPQINLDQGLAKTAEWIKANVIDYKAEAYNI